MCCRRISQIHQCSSSICAALTKFIRVPEPLVSYEEFERFWHADLGDAPSAEVRRELASLRHGVALLANPDPWYAERIEKLELALRHGH